MTEEELESRADNILRDLGFDPDDKDCPSLPILRKDIRKKVERGLVASGASWTGESNNEARAQELIRLNRAIELGLFYKIRNLDGDGPLRIYHNAANGTKRTVIKWGYFIDTYNKRRVKLLKLWLKLRGKYP